MVVILLSGYLRAQDQILGEYWIDGRKGKIAVYNCDSEYCGKIVWREEVRKDTENPDPVLRDRSVIGIEFMQGFKYDDGGKIWEEGSVYSIENGSTYSGKMWLEDGGNTLKMRGYIGISLLGKTMTLRRAE